MKGSSYLDSLAFTIDFFKYSLSAGTREVVELSDS